jgi:tetratricopeptide (TPR) repeat protein
MIIFRKGGAKSNHSHQEGELKRLIRRTPNELTAYLELSELYQDQARFEDAEKILREGLEIPLELSEWSKTSNRLGWALFNQEKYDAALDIAKSVIAKVSESASLAEAHYLAGACYSEKWDLGVESAAHEEYHLACVSNLESALAAAKTVKDDDLQGHVLASLASIKEVEGHLEEAIELLQNALSLPNLELHTLRACYAQLGCLYDDYYQDYDKAKHHFEEAIKYGEAEEATEKSNELSWIYRRLAIAQKLSGDISAALASASKALEKVDMSVPAIGKIREADAHRLIGDLNYETNQFDVAIKHYGKYLDLEQGDDEGRARVQMYLGYALMGTGDYRRARKHLSAALRSDLISDAKGYILAQLGHAVYQLEDFRQAVQYYTEALEHLKEDGEVRPTIYRKLGHSCFYLREYAEAARNYREALRLVTPNDPFRAKLLQYLAYANERK